ncbi:MAG: undecaprenyl-diphosphatase UppP [Candidatus Kapaibacterium sp.]
MSILQAIIIGCVQGLTEFIPVSSTAHMTLCAGIMGLHDPAHPERWTAFMAIVQLGTLAAVLLYFARDIRSIVAQTLSQTVQRVPLSRQSDDARTGWFVVFGTVPIFVIGYAMKKLIEGGITKDPHLIAAALILVSGVLYAADRFASVRRTLPDLTLRDGIIIGLAQCFALIPGTSRSGATIAAGLFLGLTREAAARYSFLLSIPAIGVSGAYEFVKNAPLLDTGDLAAVVTASVVAAVTGYMSIAFFLRFLRDHSLNAFILYRLALGVLVLVFL